MLFYLHSGRVLKELGYRRTDLIVTTKLFWGLRSGPNDGGLSRKQYVLPSIFVSTNPLIITKHHRGNEGIA